MPGRWMRLKRGGTRSARPLPAWMQRNIACRHYDVDALTIQDLAGMQRGKVVRHGATSAEGAIILARLGTSGYDPRRRRAASSVRF